MKKAAGSVSSVSSDLYPNSLVALLTHTTLTNTAAKGENMYIQAMFTQTGVSENCFFCEFWPFNTFWFSVQMEVFENFFMFSWLIAQPISWQLKLFSSFTDNPKHCLSCVDGYYK